MSQLSQHETISAAVASCIEKYKLHSRPLCVGYSGGIDSTVLLHALSKSGLTELRAVHVDHQLHAAATGWALHCRTACEALGIPLAVLQVNVDSAAAGGPEAAARQARYTAISQTMTAGEVLLTAHHQTDQLETYLLQLFRGAGLRGLAAMGRMSSRGTLQIARPLLDVSATAVLAYAAKHALRWIEDPSNSDTRFDRNYIRHVVIPAVLERWPAAERTVDRAARLSAEAVEILELVAADDLRAEGEHAGRLPLELLKGLPLARQKNAFRELLRRGDLPIPSEKQLGAALDLMLHARADSSPVAAWPGVRLYRYRDVVWLYSEARDPASTAGPASYRWNAEQTLSMGSVRGTLQFGEQTLGGVAEACLDGELQVRFRQGGERLRPGPNSRTRDLKKLLQESDIPPWLRCHIPLIYAGECLLAVGDLWVNSEFAAAPGSTGRKIIWSDHSVIR